MQGQALLKVIAAHQKQEFKTMSCQSAKQEALKIKQYSQEQTLMFW